MRLERKFLGLFRPNSVAESHAVSTFTQKAEKETVHPNIFLAPKSHKMCPPLLKTCSGWLRNLIARDVRGSPQSRFLVFRLKMSIVDCETPESISTIRNSLKLPKHHRMLWFHSANEEFFWCQEISTYKLVNKLFDVFSRHIGGSPKHARNMLIQW